MPVPQAANFADLNTQLRAACDADHHRVIGDRAQTVGSGIEVERASLLPLLEEGFEIAEVSFHIVDGKGCVRVRTNFYSTPLRAGAKVRVRVLPASVEVWHDAKLVALCISLKMSKVFGQRVFRTFGARQCQAL